MRYSYTNSISLPRNYLTGTLKRMVDNAQRISNNSRNILFSYQLEEMQ